MNELYYKISFVILWVIYIAIRIPHEKKYKMMEKIKSINPSKENTMKLVLMIGMLIIPLFWVFSNWFVNYNLNMSSFIRIFGIILSTFSLIYFWKIHKTLGKNWSPILEILKDHKLIKTGLYKRVRHPMYAQIWIWTISQALIISNWAIGFLGIVIWAIMYINRINNEEKMMIEEFGDEYINYQKVTGKIIPKISTASR